MDIYTARKGTNYKEDLECDPFGDALFSFGEGTQEIRDPTSSSRGDKAFGMKEEINRDVTMNNGLEPSVGLVGIRMLLDKRELHLFLHLTPGTLKQQQKETNSGRWTLMSSHFFRPNPLIRLLRNQYKSKAYLTICITQ